MSCSFLRDQICHLCHVFPSATLFCLDSSKRVCFAVHSIRLCYFPHNCNSMPKSWAWESRVCPSSPLDSPEERTSRWRYTRRLVRERKPGALFGCCFLVSLRWKTTVTFVIGVGLPWSVKPCWKHLRSVLPRWHSRQRRRQCGLTSLQLYYDVSGRLGVWGKHSSLFTVTSPTFAFFLGAFTLHLKLRFCLANYVLSSHTGLLSQSQWSCCRIHCAISWKSSFMTPALSPHKDDTRVRLLKSS